MTVARREVFGWLAAVLSIPVGDLLAAVERKGSGGAAFEPIGPEYISTLRTANAELISIEVRKGGTDVVPLASRYVTELRHRLAVSNSPFESELLTAAAELFGTAAWMAHDAENRWDASQLSYEALHLANLAGDRRVQILTLSNLALFKLYYGQPQEALAIARRMLDGPLTNYQQAIFQTREARALAALGNVSEALRVIEQAKNAFLDGPAPAGNEWWWLTQTEISGHEALVREAADRYDLALPIWQQLADASVPEWHGTTWAGQSYLRYQRLFRAAIETGDWRTAEDAVDRLVPYVGVVHCGRVDNWLIESFRLLRRMGNAPSSLRMSGQQLGQRLLQT